MSRKAELNKKMKAWLEIKHNNYDDYWDVKVIGKGKEIFYKKCLFKWSAWLSFFVWKHVIRRIKNENKQHIILHCVDVLGGCSNSRILLYKLYMVHIRTVCADIY